MMKEDFYRCVVPGMPRAEFDRKWEELQDGFERRRARKESLRQASPPGRWESSEALDADRS